jgi:NADH-quinone oxidoreductase subunit K
VNVPTEHLLVLSALLFAIGVAGFFVRRNLIVVLMSVELMLNAANLAFLAGARQHAARSGTLELEGPVMVTFVIVVAAVEAAVGLALVIALYRRKQTVSLDQVNELKD